MSLWMTLAFLFYFALLSGSIYFLLPPIRNALRTEGKYEKNLRYIVIMRQVLLFLAPTAVLALISIQTTLEQLVALFALGLSIDVFWASVFPQLTKAQLFIDFRVDNARDFKQEILLDAGTEQLIVTRIYNMGFGTLKNTMVLAYFGNGFEIVPFNDPKYRGIDFEKEFTIQTENCGALFAPSKNYQTIPSQEWFLFPLIVNSPSGIQNRQIAIQLASENSWGLTTQNFIIEFK